MRFVIALVISLALSGAWKTLAASPQSDSPPGQPSASAQPAAAPQPSPAAQPSPDASAPSAGGALGVSDDRFSALRAEADQLKAAYEGMDGKSMTEIDQLMRTRRCQINRIGGLLDRTLDSMHQWLDAERQYWKVWADVEQKRVDGQQKTLASIEADQVRTGDLIANEKDAREELLRKKADLEKYGKRTQEIISQMDSLVKDIQDSEARLASAQKDYDELTVEISNMKASISTRLVDMRQSTTRLDAYEQQLTAFYEKSRAAAQEVCNTKQPDTKRTPLPKRAP